MCTLPFPSILSTAKTTHLHQIEIHLDLEVHGRPWQAPHNLPHLALAVPDQLMQLGEDHHYFNLLVFGLMVGIDKYYIRRMSSVENQSITLSWSTILG